MSVFEDMLMEDLDEVFFDRDFFGSEHTIDDKPVTVIVDNELLNQMLSGGNDEIFRDDIALFVREEDIQDKLTVNCILELDGKPLFVHSALLDAGVYKLMLGRNQI